MTIHLPALSWHLLTYLLVFAAGRFDGDATAGHRQMGVPARVPWCWRWHRLRPDPTGAEQLSAVAPQTTVGW